MEVVDTCGLFPEERKQMDAQEITHAPAIGALDDGGRLTPPPVLVA
jgi:hypothetical protein